MNLRHNTHFVRDETVSFIEYTLDDPNTVQYTADGEAIIATHAAPVEIEANVQPATGEDLQQLPEGRRNKETLNIWTRTSIKNQDRIVRYGKTYQIDHINNWESPSSTLPHYHGIMTRYGDR